MFVESGYISLNKYGEELCGDKVETVNSDAGITMVLADGLGSGVKANILSTLTSKILGTMIANGMEIEEAVQTIAHTLPVCSQRKIAYSTFTVLSVGADGQVSLIQFDNPAAIYLHHAVCTEYPMKEKNVYGKRIFESRFRLEEGDMLIVISDGIVHAGVGKIYNLGWQRSNICKFVEENFSRKLTAKGMAALLTGASRQLYIDKPGDDATAAVIRMRSEERINVMIGPPGDRNFCGEMVEAFLSQPGKRVVCGGTTSQIVAEHLKEKVETQLAYASPDIPPTARIKGIDLVTEGVLTVSRVLEYANNYKKPEDSDSDSFRGEDGASRLAKLLIENSTHIHFFVGTAINPAHQNPGFPAKFAMKPKIVKELAGALKSLGKNVTIEFF